MSAARRASIRATRSRSSGPSRSARASTTTWAPSTRTGSSRSAKTTGWLRETELVPKTQGIVSALKETRFALALARRGKVPIPFPPHVAEDVKEARALYNLVKEQDKNGAAGIVQGEKGLGRIEFLEEEGARVNAPETEPGVEPPPAEG